MSSWLCGKCLQVTRLGHRHARSAVTGLSALTRLKSLLKCFVPLSENHRRLEPRRLIYFQGIFIPFIINQLALTAANCQ
ncbi:hypothetical protein LIPSTDRAFT_123716 [Lipomyces starkeyi NRRL Y-11557]|uniref:Uncharacterized protein n=1 Tax=Lipomyces starkeyi NRRL Y-11557 TaxID=675824 RepID=A0A1E3QER0_LIPST|nr:hypothetical protein LIPSTDRAFT_123716 [Lipomyces starkeyi NRRL Y-11557]